MNQIVPQLRRGFGLRFWLAAIAFLVLVIFGYLQPMLRIRQERASLYQGYHNVFFADALSSDILASFLPALAAAPMAAGYLDDIKSKFARFLVIRESNSRYLIGQVLACGLCGGLAVLLGTGTAYGLTVLILTPIERVVEGYTPVETHIVGKLALLALNGSLWSVLGMMLSTFMESNYIAYVSPFIVYYLLVILVERYFPAAWLFYPMNWINPEIWPYGIGSAVLFLLELTFLCGLVFYIRGERRLEQL